MRKVTEIPAETLLALEEAEHLLRQLTVLTERGRITWHCIDYNPLDLTSSFRVSDFCSTTCTIS